MNNSIKIKKLTTAALLVTIGVVSSHIIIIPIGVSKVFPVQHAINLLSAVILGPYYAVGVAFSTSLLRNLLGVGSLLAFPGSMIGAFLAGILFKMTKKPILALIGEVFGTGILGAIASYPIAKLLMGSDEAVLFGFVTPFVLSSFVGVVIGYAVFNALKEVHLTKYINSDGNDYEFSTQESK